MEGFPYLEVDYCARLQYARMLPSQSAQVQRYILTAFHDSGHFSTEE